MFIGRETKGVPWSIRISLGMPTRLKIKTSSRTMFADFMEGYCLGVSSGIVDNYQDVFMSPTRLGKGPYKVYAYPLKGHLNYRHWV